MAVIPPPPPGTGGAPSGASALLDSVAENLLVHSPEGATALGIDTGARAAMRGQLSDRSPAGVAALAETLKADRSEEHTSELQSLMRISYAVFCLKKKKNNINNTYTSTLQTPTQ